MTKWKVDKKQNDISTSRQNSTLTKWHFDKMAS